MESNLIKFKKELTMSYDNFKKPIMLENLEALAQIIQNIILIEKGTYPNQPNLGVGISNYLFELGSANTLSDLKIEIEKQISSNINAPEFTIQTDVKMIKSSQELFNSLSISIIIKYFEYSNNDIEEKSTSFNILFGGHSKTKKIVSKIIL